VGDENRTIEELPTAFTTARAHGSSRRIKFKIFRLIYNLASYLGIAPLCSRGIEVVGIDIHDTTPYTPYKFTRKMAYTGEPLCLSSRAGNCNGYAIISQNNIMLLPTSLWRVIHQHDLSEAPSPPCSPSHLPSSSFAFPSRLRATDSKNQALSLIVLIGGPKILAAFLMLVADYCPSVKQDATSRPNLRASQTQVSRPSLSPEIFAVLQYCRGYSCNVDDRKN